MDINSGKLTEFFEEPFWAGVCERIENGKLSVCKVTFSAEPKDYEVWEFILRYYYQLRFSPSVDVVVKKEATNPKRVQREENKLEPFQLHLQMFCQEEFLRRLAASRYAENLVLKGGLFIYTLTNFESRATVDIDFLLQQFPGRIEDIKRMVDEIISVDGGNDLITFTSRG